MQYHVRTAQTEERTASSLEWLAERLVVPFAGAETMDGLSGTAVPMTPPAGLGVDIEEVARFARMPFQANVPFYRRFFSPAEIDYCLSRPAPAQHFAARFAAKEAAVKAFSPHIELFPWQIEVKRLESGRPVLAISDFERGAPLEAAERFATLVSLSHTQSLAASVVLAYDVDAPSGGALWTA